MKQSQRQRFLLISIVPPAFSLEQAEEDLSELKSLVETYQGATVVDIIQRRAHPDRATYIGSGKALEVAEIVQKKNIDVVVINGIVKASQLYHILKLCWDQNARIQIWDRVDLILHIFANHAATSEAKLQIELASMRHMGPRIYGLGESFSQQGGGVGTKGLGETNVELMKRHWRDEMRRKQEKLREMETNRLKQVERRHALGLPTVSIVGYTNVGKTSLFNLLTGKEKLAKNVLFATLDSVVGKLYFKDIAKEVLISDTIGFIQNLPPGLIDAFKSTLMESVHADILLHVIDIADPKMEYKIEVVESILRDLKLVNRPKIYVFNKIDRVDKDILREVAEQYSAFSPQFISVLTGVGIKSLYYFLQEKFN
ncbi:GTPase HflX [Candidatus Roizmanbacteria bacterium CG_4_10_14_0_8_um_filter_39_9]|uniref:GTPase HflX n=1 Tax=Candidatus Roizmanbacteria bacterium CG_4_10_14_0_8_um_filter_39_9 TaxID=1974829 RepID=A0A2M7QET5_9BACT|nr:MAG: GTPase HflX [Candidatus Roizmanbacteria bacterium CG_4_10_14_0_8_um_filter_39_9]